MKTIFIRDLQKQSDGTQIVLLGWLKARRAHKTVVFLDIVDSTGTIQAVISRDDQESLLAHTASTVPIESAVEIRGVLTQNKNSHVNEIIVSAMTVISAATRIVSPSTRSLIDIFDTQLADHLLSNRHLYIRNERVMSVLHFRHLLMGLVHQWFRDNGFIEICAPVLTALPLYDDNSALSLDVHDEHVFLTQCVGFYLESAVHAFERVYNIGPSFRGEESRSKRHLMEYWHIKAELAFGDREDIMQLVESLITYILEHLAENPGNYSQVLGRELCFDGLSAPYPRISYREALSILSQEGMTMQFGTSLGSEEEELLSKRFDRPFWVVGIPRKIEPFPYVIDPDDPEVTMTADLIATRGFGELLGVAEKIPDIESLRIRMGEKGKLDRPEYRWLLELREIGCVPHIGFGMGVERFIRWVLQIPHVRDAIPFPRTFRRTIYP